MAIKGRIRRMLIIKTRSIGDTVLLSGILRVLHEKRPGYTFDVVVRTPGGELLEGLPYIDRLICIKDTKSKVGRFSYWMRLIRRLRERKYEYVLNFHSSFRTAAFSKFLRANHLVSNNHDLNKKNWFTDIEVPNRGIVKAIIDRDLDVLRAIDIHVQVNECFPEIRLNPAEIKNVKDRFQENVIEKGVRIFMGIGGSRPAKRWSTKSMAQLVKLISKDHDLRFIFALTKEDQSWIEEFKKNLSGDKSILEKMTFFENLTLREAASIVSECDLYVGNDSSMKHIAVAFKKPTFTIFGPEQPLEWHPYPYSEHPYAFVDTLDCRTESGKHWCAIENCSKYEHQCMGKIKPEDIFPVVVSLIEKLEK